MKYYESFSSQFKICFFQIPIVIIAYSDHKRVNVIKKVPAAHSFSDFEDTYIIFKNMTAFFAVLLLIGPYWCLLRWLNNGSNWVKSFVPGLNFLPIETKDFTPLEPLLNQFNKHGPGITLMITRIK